MNQSALLCFGRCGWVHAAVTRDEAVHEVAEFNAFYEQLSPTQRLAYPGRSSLGRYEQCRRCGASYQAATVIAVEAVPRGITIRPLIIAESKA